MSKKKKTLVPGKAKGNVSFVEALAYGFGDLAGLLSLTFVSNYLKVFYTDCLLPGHGVSATQISSDLTVLFLVLRLWDAINDPLCGLLVDTRRPSKNGKFRPYLRIVSIPLGLSCALCFMNLHNVTSSYTVLLVFAYISYCLYGMMYTLMNVPYGSLASAISDNPKDRTLLSTFRSAGSGIGGGIVLILCQSLIYDNKTTLNAKKTFITALVLAISSVACYMFSFYGTKERVKYADEKKKVSFKQTYGSLFKSKPFITVALAGILISGLLQFNSFNQYLTKNYFANSNLSIGITIGTYAPMVMLILFVPKLAEKFGKKELSSSGLFLSVLGSIMLCLIGPSDYVRSHSWLFIVANFIIGTGYSFASILNWAIVGDVIDYQENVTGVKNESAIYAVYTFCRKVGQTIADTAGIQLLYKYTKYDPEVSVFGYIPGVGERMYKMVSRVTLVAYVIILILYLLYPLDKKKLTVMYEQLAEKRAQRAESIEEVKLDGAQQTAEVQQ